MASSSPLLNQEIDLERLPKEMHFGSYPLYKWNGFWYDKGMLLGMLAFQSDFEAHPDDVFLASSMKTGTTWLKAICFCIMRSRGKANNNNSNTNGEEDDDELVKDNPHACVRTLEYDVYRDCLHPDLSGMSSPRLFHTHVPYCSLPDSIKNSNCKIVYITRNPKDTLVSLWHFYNKLIKPKEIPYPLGKLYESFCEGVHPYGPYFDHVLGYWSQSLKMPERILFMKYEDLKRDPRGQVKRLALFLGKPFIKNDEVDMVLWRTSLDRLQNLEVNKNGVVFQTKIPNSSFFRLGVVGDWRNHFTEEMKEGLNSLTRLKLEDSGLDLEI